MAADMPSYDLTRQTCAGSSITCSAGDQDCVARVNSDGLVAFARHGASLEYCPKSGLGTRPTGLGLMAVGALIALVAVVVVVRKRLALRTFFSS